MWPTTPVIERVLAKIVVDETTGCWLYSGSLEKNGYARVTQGRRNSRRVYAHRVVYEHYNGPIPARNVLDHKCRTRHCINPEHTHPVTGRQNILENSLSFTAINAKKTCCPACGGPYEQDCRGRRWCRPCRNAHRRNSKLTLARN